LRAKRARGRVRLRVNGYRERNGMVGGPGRLLASGVGVGGASAVRRLFLRTQRQLVSRSRSIPSRASFLTSTRSSKTKQSEEEDQRERERNPRRHPRKNETPNHKMLRRAFASSSSSAPSSESLLQRLVAKAREVVTGQTLVGTDPHDNRYYRWTDKATGAEKRRVVVSGGDHLYDPNRLPPEWRAWLQKTRREAPTPEETLRAAERAEVLRGRIRAIEERERARRLAREHGGGGGGAAAVGPASGGGGGMLRLMQDVRQADEDEGGGGGGGQRPGRTEEKGR
jgi:NADH:ubiquinone oxidoreductase subunit